MKYDKSFVHKNGFEVLTLGIIMRLLTTQCKLKKVVNSANTLQSDWSKSNIHLINCKISVLSTKK